MIRNFFLALLMLPASVTAQTTADVTVQEKVWSLNSCMKYAVDNSPKVKKQQHTDDTYRGEYQSAVGSFFPSVSVGSQGYFGFGRSIDPKTNTYNNVSTFSNSYNLSASLPVFDGGQLINQFRSAKVNRRIGTTAIEKEKDDLSLNVMQAFIDVVYYRGTVTLASEQLAESHRVLYKTKRQEELGIKGKADVAQIESQVAANDYNLTRQQNLLNTAMLTLKSHMNYPGDHDLSIDTLFAEQSISNNTASPSEIYHFATEHNPTARLASLKLRNAELQHLVSKGRLYPTISISGGISTNYFQNLDPGDDDTPPLPFFDQFKNNRGEYISINFSLPLFNGLTRMTGVRRARNNRRIAHEEQVEVFRQLQTAVEQSILDRDGYTKEVIQMEKKVSADLLAYQITLRKFEEGLMSPLDLQLSANTLLLSKADLLQRRLSLIVKSKLVEYYSGAPLINEE